MYAYKSLFILFTLLTIQYPTLSMHRVPEQNDLIDQLHEEINKQFPIISLSEFLGVYFVSESDYLTVIKIVENRLQHNNTSNTNIFDMLSAKNPLFKKMLSHFVDIAIENFKNVSPDTLDTITNSTATQSTQELNCITNHLLKKYIMDLAENAIKQSYTMYFRPENQSEIIAFALSANTDTMAISTGSRISPHRLELMNLKTGKKENDLDETNPALHLCFNTSGSQLATVINTKKGPMIKMWNMATKHPLWTMTNYTYIPEKIIYSDDTENLCLFIGKKTGQKKYDLSEYTLDIFTSLDSQNPTRQGMLTKLFDDKNTPIVQNPYTVHKKNSQCITVTKQGCIALALCTLATQRATNEQHLSLIESSEALRKSTTHYETNLIKSNIIEKKQKISRVSNK